jgi:hypothetical protein
MTSMLLLALCGAAFSDDLLATQRATNASSAGPSLGENTSSYVRDYLSDPRRAGSLAGSILGGALSAHPAGPVLGSLVGFFIGKQSMFNEEKTSDLKAGLLYARRDIVPQNGLPAPTLSLTNVQRINFDVPDAGMGNQVSMPIPAFGGLSREQLAVMCGGGPNVDPRFRSLCFYSSGS